MKFPNSTDGLLAEENPELFFLSPSAQRDYLIAEGFVQTDDSSNTWILDTGIEHRECIFLPKSGLVAFDTHDGRRRIFLSGSGTYSVLLDEAGTSRIVFVTFPDIEGVFLYRLGAGGATTPVSAPDGWLRFDSAADARVHVMATRFTDRLDSLALNREKVAA